MRIIDKYLVKEFAVPLLYCFDAFVMLWIVLDLLDNLGDFIQYHAKVGQIFQYYLIVVPEAFVMILPISLLLAVLFCLSNLGKHNELIALRASGVSVGRLALPLLAIGVIAAGCVFAVNEAFVPHAKDKAAVFISELRGKTAKYIRENFFFANTTEQRDWFARRFNTRTRELEFVEVHQRKPDNKPLLDVFAASAVWTNNAWRFREVDIYDYSSGQQTVYRAAVTNFPAFNENPRRLALEGREPDQLTSSELRRQIAALERARRLGHIADYQVTLQYRYAFPLICFMVMWIGIPLGMRVSRRGPMLGVGMALLLVVAFYFLTNISLALGKGQHLAPALAAWLTNAVFGVIGAVLLARSR